MNPKNEKNILDDTSMFEKVNESANKLYNQLNKAIEEIDENQKDNGE